MPPDDTWSHISTAFGQNAGIYILRAASTNGGLRSVRRLFRDDEAGTLYIGSGNPIIGRFGGLRTGIFAAYKQPKSTGKPYAGLARHGVGSKMSASFREAFELNDLVIDVVSWDADGAVPLEYDCRQHEAQVLSDYLEAFGEAPPLNRSMPGVAPSPRWVPTSPEPDSVDSSKPA